MAGHCVVLAGGLGTRIREVTNGLVPKIMVPVLGQPFIKWKLESLREMGVTEVTLLIGELGNLVEDYLWHNYPTGLSIQCLHDGPKLLGTAGSIRKVLHKLPQEFWITYGDSYVLADLEAAESKLTKTSHDGIMTLFHNMDTLEISNASTLGDLVFKYDKNSKPGEHEWIDYGLLYLKSQDFLDIPIDQVTDLEIILGQIIHRKRMMMWETKERFWDVGTPEALQSTEDHFRQLSL